MNMIGKQKKCSMNIVILHFTVGLWGENLPHQFLKIVFKNEMNC